MDGVPGLEEQRCSTQRPRRARSGRSWPKTDRLLSSGRWAKAVATLEWRPGSHRPEPDIGRMPSHSRKETWPSSWADRLAAIKVVLSSGAAPPGQTFHQPISWAADPPERQSVELDICDNLSLLSAFATASLTLLGALPQACLAGSRRIHPTERVAQEVELAFWNPADACLLLAACEELDMNDNSNPTPQPGELTCCFARVACSTI
jgi:hypothetical protein